MMKWGSFLKPDPVGLCPLLGLDERGVGLCADYQNLIPQ